MCVICLPVHRLGVIVSFIAFIALISLVVLAQSPPPPAVAKNPIRVTTNEVTIPVTVTTRHGELVLNLSQSHFHVFDNGVEQKLDHWELGGDPLAVALVLDTSSRLHSTAPAIHSLGIIFADTVMALDSQAAMITYDSTVTIRQPFTSDRDVLEKAIEGTKFETPEMDLHDGMAAGVHLLETQPRKWRRIMLVVGESQDSGSRATLGEIVREAERADISIFVVGESSVGADLRSGKLDPTPLKIRGLPPITAAPCSSPVSGYGDSQCIGFAIPSLWLLERGTNEIKHHQLEVAAAATGGFDYSGLRESALQSALDRIGSELHAQYILSFSPPSDGPPGFHILRVTVDQRDVIVRARPGYYLKSR